MRAPGEAPLGASSAAELGKLWRPRAQLGQPVQETLDPNLLARGNNPNISSLLHHPSEPTPSPAAKKTHFSAAARLRGLGCTAAGSQQVSVPAVIRASADWGRRKGRKKQKGFLQKNSVGNQRQLSNGSNFCCNSSGSCVVAEDAWCGPGIGLSVTDADCVVVVGRRNVAMPATSREKIAADRLGQREWPCLPRRTTKPELLCFLDSGQSSTESHPGVDIPRPGHRHAQPPSPEGLAEIMMMRSRMLVGGRLGGLDWYNGWRLDVDNMSYEQLLELGDRIGYVNTGLKDDEIGCCMRKIKLMSLGDLSHHFTTKTEWKCSICQEEYEEGDELGKLECSHGYHLQCIEQWLSQKNICPICKCEAAART